MMKTLLNRSPEFREAASTRRPGGPADNSPGREAGVTLPISPSPAKGESASAAPAGADHPSTKKPRLTPWAIFCRAFGAVWDLHPFVCIRVHLRLIPHAA